MTRSHPFYGADLAYIHDKAFSETAERLGPAIARLLRRRWRAPASAASRPCPPDTPRGRRRRPLIVEFGCGGGRTARHLANRGYDVIGIDASPEMIRLARRRVPEATFRVGTTRSARIPRCRAILALGEVIAYIGREPADPHGFFARAHAALEPGGVLLFDFIESADGRTYETKSRAGEDWAIVSRAAADRRGRVLMRHITSFRKIGSVFRRGVEVHRVRIFTRREIEAALRRAGFVVRMQYSLGGVRLMRGGVFAVATKPMTMEHPAV